MEDGDSGARGLTAPEPVGPEFSQQRGNVTTPSKTSYSHGITLFWFHKILNSLRPEFGGKYCTGERKRYRTCNTKPCQNDKPTFREMLCSEFDTVPYHNELYQWTPVANPCKWL